MKSNPLLIQSMLAALAFLAILAGGCASKYGPGSPDYYPVTYPPFELRQMVMSPRNLAGVHAIVPVSSMPSAAKRFACALKNGTDRSNLLGAMDCENTRFYCLRDSRQ